MKGKRFSSAGTDIEQVKRQNAQANRNATAFGSNNMEEFGQEASFSSSNKASLGKTMAGTDIAHVKQQNAQAGNGKMMTEFGQEASFSSNKASLGKTVADTDIAHVKQQNANPSNKG